MTQRRRELLFRVMDGDSRVLPYLHHFDSYRECDVMLNWLIVHGLTGMQFMEWSKQFNSSFLEPARFILTHVYRSHHDGKLIAGRDTVQ